MNKKLSSDDFDASNILDIEEILRLLHQSNDSDVKMYFHGAMVDYGFGFKVAAQQEDITFLEKAIGYAIPEDYKKFLTFTNGLSFNHYDANIYSIEEVLSFKNTFDYPNYMLVVATSMSSQIQIALNLQRDFDSVYVIDPIADDHFYSIGSNFTEFFNRFIVSYGSDYWNWGYKNTLKIPKSVDSSG
ncbi:SMI1/KNR4 family protein [Paenibacillus arenilitoris]|uniref:SMI1/KNR4 family protein n=1 Tax=Paenibacillus arenilitoris TaxID=2772299 RepID=A0A927CMH6_9BACL|nr:SMI1/KNR4 family protein [Paenibacillus arenilitoris]MBD2868881.1 SMI1/KNR4 family protein [Paenibacillus arenilitoris]